MANDALEVWHQAGPLSEESEELLKAVETARSEGRDDKGAWIAFLHSLTARQQRAVLGLIEEFEASGTLIA